MRTILITLFSFVWLFADTHHIANKTVTAGETVELSISVNQTFNIRAVYLHYKTNTADEYTTVKMSNIGFEYMHKLLIPEHNYTNLEYYFSVVDRRGLIKTDPVENAYGKPYISQIVSYERQVAVDYLIISPEENEKVAQEDFMVSVSLLAIPPEFNLENSKVFIDGIDITKFVDFDVDLISWVPVNRVAKGPHNLEVVFYDNSQNEISKAAWNFNIVDDSEGTESLGGSQTYSYSGSFSLNNRSESYGDPDAEVGSENFLTTSGILNGLYGPLEARFQFSTSSEQDDNVQDINRLSFFSKYEPFDDIYIRADFGDVTPAYNEQMISFENMNGFDVGLYLGIFNFEFASGKNRKEIILDQFDEITFDENNNPTDTTTVSDPNTAYEREFTAGRFSIGNKDRDGFSIGFNFLKSTDNLFKDTLDNVKASYTPSENLVVGTDFLLGLNQNRVRFTAGFLGSVLMDDVSGGTIPFEDLEELNEDIGENTLLKDNYDRINDIITISGIPSLGITYYSAFDFNLWGQYIKLRYDYVDAGFHSDANPFLVNDISRFSYFHSSRFFDNQLYLNFSLKAQSNNVAEEDEFNTTNIDDFSVGFTFYPKFDFPNVSFTLTSNAQEDVNSGDSLQSSINNQQINTTLSHALDIGGINTNLSIIFGTGSGDGKSIIDTDMDNDLTDEIAQTDKTLNSTTTNFALTGSFNYPGIPLRLFAEFSTFESGAGKDVNGVDNLSTNSGFRTNGTYDLFSNEESGTLGAFAEIAFSSTETTGEDFGFDEVSQSSFAFGGNYKYNISETVLLNAFLRFKNVGLSATAANYTNSYITFSTSVNF